MEPDGVQVPALLNIPTSSVLYQPLQYTTWPPSSTYLKPQWVSLHNAPAFSKQPNQCEKSTEWLTSNNKFSYVSASQPFGTLCYKTLLSCNAGIEGLCFPRKPNIPWHL
mmetsp:Transcript_11715/g.19925  ORF Transcript_11715/g.19925 Transcript_11715/m.19925 type:complete len:109 (-) Transcript_11715:886-1212(-)